jgi:hypothetical protein
MLGLALAEALAKTKAAVWADTASSWLVQATNSSGLTRTHLAA